MIIFSNPGLIDIRALTTLGINAKENPSAIGYFGSGAKYAIACILRWGGSITIYRGTERYSFTTVEHETRGKKFSIVCMNGNELGFVTDYGKNWQPWQVYRELWTNAMDEAGAVTEISTDDLIPGMEDFTTVVVDCDEITKAHA